MQFEVFVVNRKGGANLLLSCSDFFRFSFSRLKEILSRFHLKVDLNNITCKRTLYVFIDDKFIPCEGVEEEETECTLSS
jgi:hypothetical protein